MKKKNFIIQPCIFIGCRNHIIASAHMWKLTLYKQHPLIHQLCNGQSVFTKHI